MSAAKIFHAAVAVLIWSAAVTGIAAVPQSTSDPFMGFAVTDPPFESITYGVQAFLWWGDWWATVHSQWIQTMAFTHVKQTFAWEDIEPIPGQYNFTDADRLIALIESRGLRLVARLSDAPPWSHPSVPGEKEIDYIDAPPDNLTAWAAFCGALAERYRGRIAAYQLWNEPNLSREWGGREPNAAGYVALMAACSDAIRAVDPAAILISAGLAPTGTYDQTAHPDDVYLQAMYDAGFQRYIDVVGMHAPGYAAPHISPAQAEANGSQRFFTFRRVEDLRTIMVANGDAARQVALLEVGWTTDTVNPAYAWFAVDEPTQAQYLVEAYRYAAERWNPWVGLMSTIYIGSPEWKPEDEEYWWSLTTPQGGTRLAYILAANMPKYCGAHLIPERPGDSPEALGQVPAVNCLTFAPG
ncbi:MAG: cellulase family glycosylhydrolase [bacterium]|nr:cellulase family glycosylhydrolase [bacterium]